MNHHSRHTTQLHCAALTALALAVTATASCGRRSQPATAAAVHIAPRDTTAPYDGIDISSHQGDIDWGKVTADKSIRFVYIKATEGATYSSPHYGYNVTMARRHGLLVGSYHYFTTTSSVSAQFRNFSNLAALSSQDLIPMIDVEHRGNWSRNQLVDSVATFARLVKEHYGVQPMIYSTMAFYNRWLAPSFNSYPLYIGRYNDQEPEVSWNGSYTVWQFSQSGIIPGIDAYVDLCHYRNGAWLDEIAMPPHPAI